jgi:hypothetical protein
VKREGGRAEGGRKGRKKSEKRGGTSAGALGGEADALRMLLKVQAASERRINALTR